MNSYSVKYNTLNKEKLYQVLVEWSEFFIPELNSYVADIESYANKMHKYATIIEAYNNEELIGFLMIYLNSKTAYITNFVIKPEYKGKKLSDLLLNESILKAKKLNYENIQLECFEKNLRALSFYLKHGFKMTKKNPPKILMQLDI